MATVARAADSLPAAGTEQKAAPITDTFTNILSFLEGNNIDENNVDYSSADGIAVLAQAQTFTGAKTFSAATQFSNTVTVGANDTGYDVKMWGDTSGKYWLWDTSADGVVLVGSQTQTGNSQLTGTLTVGVNDTGHDVKFFGATSGSYMLWDESADQLILTVPTSTGPADGNFALNQTATATGDLLGITFCQDGTISRTRAAVYSVAENDSGTGLSLAFFTRLAVDATQLQATDERMRIDSSGNVLIGATAKGTGAAGVLTIANGTQGAALANAVQIVSKDLSAGNTQLSVRTEGGGAVSASVATASTHKFAIEIDGTQYYLLMTT